MNVPRDEQDSLHADVCSNDATAWSRAFTLLLDPLIDALSFKWPKLKDTDQLRDAAVDSLMAYVRDPGRYDPSRASLLTYLRLDAHGDLLNAYVRSEAAPRVELVDVEVADQEGKGWIDDYPSDREPPMISLAEIREAFPAEGDRRAILLMINGERSTAMFAQVWELDGLSDAEQAAAVKRNKDRVRARIKRMRQSA